MSVFYLKYRDTRPILEVTLLDTDSAAHDLTGVDSVSLHIRLVDGTEITKAMTVYDATGGIVRYTWLAADWTSDPVLTTGVHAMEYEVIAGTARLTFPNNGNDQLIVADDIGNT